MNSIIQSEKKCFFCGLERGLELHHIFYGSANRKISDAYGLTVWLCMNHHRGTFAGVHFNKEMDLHLKKIGQQAFEEKYPHLSFLQIFGKNYL